MDTPGSQGILMAESAPIYVKLDTTELDAMLAPILEEINDLRRRCAELEAKVFSDV